MWNAFYDRILRSKTTKGVEFIAYADDLAVVLLDKTQEGLLQKIKSTTEQIHTNLNNMGIAIAPEKTELLILTNPIRMKSLSIEIFGNRITSAEYIKYLGIHIGKGTTLTTHVKKATEKTLTTVNALARLLPRIGGAKANKRRVLAATVKSIIFYGAQIWKRALKYQHYGKMIQRIVRQCALRITSAYRTAATAAILVIAKTPPLDLIIQERSDLKRRKQSTEKALAKAKTIERWQQRWEQNEGWTRTIIPNIKDWLNTDIETDHYVSQGLTGHNIFGSYLYRIKKKEDDKCWFCEAVDTVEHTLLGCHKFAGQRKTANDICKEAITTTNIGSLMTTAKEQGEAITNMIRIIMQEKAEYEKQLQHTKQ